MLFERKILVVGDNEINRAVLCIILSSQFMVLEAENGEQVRSLLENYREGISLILLDEIICRAREALYAAKAGGKDECLSWKGMCV